MFKTLQTITTIELANICNLQCRYCVNRMLVRHPDRQPGIMSDEVFERSIGILKQLVARGTQAEVNLNGTGESCLDPQLPARARKVKDIMGGGTVMFCTNGVNMTKILTFKLKDAGIDRIDISVHDIWHARKCAELFAEVGIVGIYSMGALTTPHDWAGQLEPENAPKHIHPWPCEPIMEGRGYISKEGALSPCCYDYRLIGVFGTVFDDDLLTRKVKPYELCRHCHQTLPKESAA